MATTPRPLVDGTLLSTTATNIYQAAASVQATRIIAASLTNVDAVANPKATIYIVPSGQAVENRYLIAKDLTVSVGETITVPGLVGHVLDPNDMLYAQADTADLLAIRISGYEFTG